MADRDGVPGEIGVFSWVTDSWSFALLPGACATCAEALLSRERQAAAGNKRQPRLRLAGTRPSPR